MKLAFTAAIFIAELLIMLNYFKNLFNSKIRTLKTILIYTAGYVVLFCLYAFITDNSIVNGAAFLAVNIALAMMCFAIKPKSAFFHSAIGTVTMFATEMITIYAISFSLGQSLDHYSNNFFLFAVDAVICKTLFFIVIKIITAIARKKNVKYDTGKYGLLMLLPLSSLLCAVLLHYLISSVPPEPLTGVFCSLLMLLQLITNITVFWVYENTQKNAREIMELQIAGQKEKLDIEYLELLEKKNSALERLMHDFKNHLSSVKGLGNTEEAEKYINSIYGSIGKYEYIGKTKNRMLDLILSKYTTMCEGAKIDFSAETYSENLKFMDDFDLSSMMNNLLDNAFEAASKTENGKITLIIKRNESGKRIIDVVNSCAEAPVTNNGELVSTKSGGIHGIGTKSIKASAEKYDGDCEWMYDEVSKTFRVIIVFPAPDAEVTKNQT